MGLLRRLIRPLYEKSKLYTLNPSPRGLLCTQISTLTCVYTVAPRERDFEFRIPSPKEKGGE